MTDAMPIEVRDAVADDHGFVVSAWLESYHDGSKIARRVLFRDYREAQRRIIHRLLRRSVAIVACDPEATGHLLGFALGERAGNTLVLHYVYVRQTRRRHGVARKLVAELVQRLSTRALVYTHETYVGEKIIGAEIRQGLEARWNPFLVWAEEHAA